MVGILIVACFLGRTLQLFGVGVDELDIVVIIITLVVLVSIVVGRQILILLLLVCLGFCFFRVLESIFILFFIAGHGQHGYCGSGVHMLVFCRRLGGRRCGVVVVNRGIVRFRLCGVGYRGWQLFRSFVGHTLMKLVWTIAMGAEAIFFEEDLTAIGTFYDFTGNFHPATGADCRFLTGLVSTFGTFDHCHLVLILCCRQPHFMVSLPCSALIETTQRGLLLYFVTTFGTSVLSDHGCP